MDLFSIFKNIPLLNDNETHFAVEEFSSDLPHRLSCSHEGYPMFFVECSDEKFFPNINLKQLCVTFSQDCKVQDNYGRHDNRKYTVILLKSEEVDIQRYFLELFYLLLRKLPKKPTTSSLKKEVSKIISVFTISPSLSNKLVKGLWAELFVIACCSDPDYLINSWHVLPEDKYDFNDGIDKIEVKATSNQERIHTFSIEQLNPNKDSQLVIASIITTNTGQGCGVFDLIESISDRISNIETLIKLKEIVYLTIGPHIEKCRKVKFDLRMASNTYKVFHYRDIPSIPLSVIPPEVGEVRFSSCLKDTPIKDLSTTTSKLYLALKYGT